MAEIPHLWFLWKILISIGQLCMSPPLKFFLYYLAGTWKREIQRFIRDQPLPLQYIVFGEQLGAIKNCHCPNCLSAVLFRIKNPIIIKLICTVLLLLKWALRFFKLSYSHNKSYTMLFPTTFIFFACMYFFSHTTFSLLDDFVETKQNHSYLEEERVYAKSRFEKKTNCWSILALFWTMII